MKITRIEIKAYRGIVDLSVDVPPEGAVFAGGNAKGKSSVLKAISAAIAAEGIGADAIRLGSDKSEILIDMDAIKVHRQITRKGGASLTVTNSDGDRWAKPQTRLTELFGTAALDCLSFFLAEPKERRKLVMEALPVTVTAEDVARWAPGATKIAGRVSLEGHGLEVLERLHKTFYDVRSEVNRAAKEARAAATAALSFPPGPDDAPTLEDAAKANTEAGQVLVQLQAREMAAVEAKKGGERTRELIAASERNAADYRARAAQGPTDVEFDAAQLSAQHAQDEVTRLGRLLDAAKNVANEAMKAWADANDRRRQQKISIKTAEEEDARVVQLRASIADVDAMGVPAEELAAARAALDKTITALEDAKAAAAARAAQEHADALAARATKTEADAAQVDEIVRRLATEAPQELAKRSALIPGLGIDGDSITLDGVSIDSLSGAEQMHFAVDLCRRLNAGCKILVVDGLERLDDDSLDAFVAAATADDWQLIGTRVSKGELVVEAISADTAAA